MLSTEIRKRRRDRRKKGSKRKIKLSSFFVALDADDWDSILAMDDLFVHLLITHKFSDDVDFSNIQSGQRINGTVEEFYKSIINNEHLGVSCKPYQLRKVKEYAEKEESMINFNEYLSRMLELRTFSLNSVENVWELQQSVEAVVSGILKAKKKEGNNFGNFDNIKPLDGEDIRIPRLNYHISGTNFPIIVQENPKKLYIKEVSNKNNDNGIVIVDENDIIYDVIKINNFWIYDYPLANRIEFLGRFQNFKPYLVCETINEVLDATETLKIKKKNGLLMRSILEGAVPNKCNWLVWSPKSKVTFKIWKERKNSPKYLRLVDDFIHEFDIDLKDINHDFIEITLDGSSYSLGFEENWWMDVDDFGVWSEILKVRKKGRKKKRVEDF